MQRRIYRRTDGRINTKAMKREQIIEILESKRLKSFGSITKSDFADIADAILALFEQKESVKKKIPKETKIKICAACGSFAHGNPGHDIT